MASASLWLYRILLGGLLPVALPAIKLRQWMAGKSRPRFRSRLCRELPELPEGGIWIQAVSVGEVEVARRLVIELSKQAPDLPVFLTATTATGLDLARRALSDRLEIFPCPIDLPGPVGRVFEAGRPRLTVLVETELWPEMLHQARRRDVPVAVVNARLSEGSFQGYRRTGRFLRPLLLPLPLPSPLRLLLSSFSAHPPPPFTSESGVESPSVGSHVEHDCRLVARFRLHDV